MARANARSIRNNPRQDAEPGGLWHQPALMNLLADLLSVLAIAALVWAALTALQRLPLFPLRELILVGTPEQVSAQQIEHTARTVVRGNFFTVDLEATRAAFEKLPWVRKASLRRNWPDGLALTLEEHEALARWRQPGGETGMVNRQGEIFVAEGPEDAARLPLLSGPDGSAGELLGRYAEFSTALTPLGRRIEAIVVSPRRAWQLRLDDGMTIELGRDQDKHPLNERLARFVAHYEAARNRLGPLQVADMRYPSGFALVASNRGGKPARTETAGRKS